jgi:hypothetical protein
MQSRNMYLITISHLFELHNAEQEADKELAVKSKDVCGSREVEKVAQWGAS